MSHTVFVAQKNRRGVDAPPAAECLPYILGFNPAHLKLSMVVHAGNSITQSLAGIETSRPFSVT